MFDRPQQVGIFLAHDAVEARGAHPRVLHLLKRPSGIDSLMLADIADDEYSILRSDLFKEVAHLPGAGQTRLVEHVEMPAAGATVGLIPSPAGEESLQRRGMDTRLAKLARRPRSRSKTLYGEAGAFRALADHGESCRFTGTGQPLQAVDPVGRGENFLDDPALRRVQKAPRSGLGRGFRRAHHGLYGILAGHHAGDIGALVGDGFRCREAASARVLLGSDGHKLAPLFARGELRPNLGKSRFTHAATQGFAQNGALVRYRFALEKTGPRIADGLFCLLVSLRPVSLGPGAIAGLGDDPFRLVAELGRQRPVRGQNLAGGKNLFAIARGVSGDLCRRRTAVAHLFKVVADLLRSGAGGIKIGLRVPLDLRSAAAPGLDFVAQTAQLIGQSRLVNRGRKALRIEQALRLDGAGLPWAPFGHIEDDGVGVKLGSGIAFDGPRGVMLELGGDEFAGGFGGVIAADPRLCVALQLVERSGDGGPVGLPHPHITADQGGERNGLGSRERRIPAGAMLDGIDRFSICIGVLKRRPLPDDLLLGYRVFAF